MKFISKLESKFISCVARAVQKRENAEKKRLAERRAGFEAVSQRDAWLMEDRLTVREKQHYCERKAYAFLRYFPDLDHPQTYSEKLIWLAIHYKNPRIAQLTDKCEMKKHIAELVGPEHVVPMIGVYENVNDIDWDALPKRFAAKSTAGWANHQVILVPDKDKLDRDRLKSQMTQWLYPWNTLYYFNMCITDERIVPRIVIEELIGDGTPAPDYKLHCFDGEPKFILLINSRGTKNLQKTFVWLEDWSVMPISRSGAGTETEPQKPDRLDEMVAMARKLSKGFPLVRVDFYVDGDRLYVGEMTFSPGMFLKIDPTEEDRRMGELIHLEGLEP